MARKQKRNKFENYVISLHDTRTRRATATKRTIQRRKNENQLNAFQKLFGAPFRAFERRKIRRRNARR